MSEVQFRSLLVILVLAYAAVFSGMVQADDPVSKSRISGVAIGGHDTVAYHDLQRAPQADAVEGLKTYTVEHQGAKWRFLSQASADLFAANPDKYRPAYNGHCANALALGEGLIRTDGTHWEIFNDELHLFFAARGRNRWNDGNWETYKEQADAAWARLK